LIVKWKFDSGGPREIGALSALSESILRHTKALMKMVQR
jgi:hypothetical protein